MPGEQKFADSLSLLLQAENQATGPLAVHKVSDKFVRFVAVTATLCAMMTRAIEEVSAEDEEFSELCHHIKSGTWRDGQLKQYISVASELSVMGKLILSGTRKLWHLAK